MEIGSSRTTNILAALALGMASFGFYADRKLDAFWPYTLSYETEGLKCDATKCELDIWVRNHGWIAQRDVRFELPDLKKDYELIHVDRGYKILKDTSRKTIDLGTVHSGSFRYISLAYPKGIEATFFSRDRLYIYSSDSEATYEGPGDEAFALPRWWWYVVYFLIAWVLLFATVRIFERPKGRYIRLLNELDKEAKGYLKCKKKMGLIRSRLSQIPDAAVNAAEAEMEKWPRWMRPKTRNGVVQKDAAIPADEGLGKSVGV